MNPDPEDSPRSSEQPPAAAVAGEEATRDKMAVRGGFAAAGGFLAVWGPYSLWVAFGLARQYNSHGQWFSTWLSISLPLAFAAAAVMTGGGVALGSGPTVAVASRRRALWLMALCGAGLPLLCITPEFVGMQVFETLGLGVILIFCFCAWVVPYCAVYIALWTGLLKRATSGHCAECGYPLGADQKRCPECGHSESASSQREQS